MLLTNGVTVNLGCLEDADEDGICDTQDACTDQSAENFNAEGNGACEYLKWFIPEELASDVAVLAVVAPEGYQEGSFACVEAVVSDDNYCVDSFWDDICQAAYLECVAAGEGVLGAFEYGVGDEGPAGGIIVYVDTFDVHRDFDYLEAAKEDYVFTEFFYGPQVESFSMDCSPPLVLQPTETGSEVTPFSSSGAEITPSGFRIRNAGGAAIGTGHMNSLELARFGTCSNFVADVAMRYEQNGFRDFFIPSIAELEVMSAVLGPLATVGLLGGGGDENASNQGMGGSYWSSTEFDATRAYGVFVLNLGSTAVLTGLDTFDSTNKIRLVRAF